jgi:hypothetical protein
MQAKSSWRGCLTVFCLAVLVATAFGVWFEVRHARSMRELSKMLYVSSVLTSVLDDHYRVHGSYPGKLEDLTLEPTRWGDEGSSQDDVKAWSYHRDADGRRYELSWKGQTGISVRNLGNEGSSQQVFDDKP